MKILGLGSAEFSIIWLAISIAIAIWCGNKAEAKGYQKILGILLGFFLSFIGVILILLFPDKKEEEAKQAPDQLIKYKQLLDVGAITQEEFDKKKSELL